MKTFPTILFLLLTTLLATMLAACSVSNTRQDILQDPSDLLYDNFFWAVGEEPAALEQPDLFSLPEIYKQDLDAILASSETEYERYTKMRAWIYRRFRDYDFDVTQTFTLAELSNNRKINCLSFSVLFVAVARYVDVPAEFQLVMAQPYWDKEGESWINNQHINVSGSVERPPTETPRTLSRINVTDLHHFIINSGGAYDHLFENSSTTQRTLQT